MSLGWKKLPKEHSTRPLPTSLRERLASQENKPRTTEMESNKAGHKQEVAAEGSQGPRQPHPQNDVKNYSLPTRAGRPSGLYGAAPGAIQTHDYAAASNAIPPWNFGKDNGGPSRVPAPDFLPGLSRESSPDEVDEETHRAQTLRILSGEDVAIPKIRLETSQGARTLKLNSDQLASSPVETFYPLHRSPAARNHSEDGVSGGVDRSTTQHSPAIPRNKLLFRAGIMALSVAALSFTAAITYISTQVSLVGKWSGSSVAWIIVSLIVLVGAGAALYILSNKSKKKPHDAEGGEGIELQDVKGKGKQKEQPPAHGDSRAMMTMSGLNPNNGRTTQDRIWDKYFSRDEQLMRRYVEGLESRVRQAEQELRKSKEPSNQKVRFAGAASSAAVRCQDIASPTEACGIKRKPIPGQAEGSIRSDSSRHHLLPPKPDKRGKKKTAAPVSTTDGSILMQLCAAVSREANAAASGKGKGKAVQTNGAETTGVNTPTNTRQSRPASIDIVCGKLQGV